MQLNIFHCNIIKYLLFDFKIIGWGKNGDMLYSVGTYNKQFTVCGYTISIFKRYGKSNKTRAGMTPNSMPIQ